MNITYGVCKMKSISSWGHENDFFRIHLKIFISNNPVPRNATVATHKHKNNYFIFHFLSIIFHSYHSLQSESPSNIRRNFSFYLLFSNMKKVVLFPLDFFQLYFSRGLIFEHFLFEKI